MAPQTGRSPRPGARSDAQSDGEPDAELPPGTDALPQIKHIVVLMMENHSYDNYFGMLTDHGDGFSLGPDGKPVGSNADSSGKQVPLTHSAKTTQHAHVPTQTWHASHIQWNNGAGDGFVRGIEQTMPGEDATAAMLYWTEAELPFYYGLARTFPLATRWFGSCLGPTFPNRRFMIAGTAHGLIDDLPFDMIDYPENGTIFDHLTAHGISWVNYHHLSRVRINWQRIGHAKGLQFLRLLGGALAALYPQFRARLESKLVVTADMYPLGYLRALNHIRPMDDFWYAASSGTLPSVTFIDPDFPGNSEENPQDIQIGEEFAARVINAVMKGKGWPHTLLIWLYDEHGGYYDHVPPPAAPAPDDVPAMSPYQRYPVLRLLSRTSLGRKVTAADAGPQTYTQLGFRVPAVVLSPYAKPGYVSEVVYDHTAILKLIERKWSLPPLTRRDAAAADILEMLDLDSAPAFLDPPVLPKPARAG
jgi:phospholipase C